MEPGSHAKEIMNYSFLVAFARNQTLDGHELQFIEKLALEDGKIDEDEKRVLSNIFGRVQQSEVAPDVWQEINLFKLEYGIV